MYFNLNIQYSPWFKTLKLDRTYVFHLNPSPKGHNGLCIEDKRVKHIANKGLVTSKEDSAELKGITNPSPSASHLKILKKANFPEGVRSTFIRSVMQPFVAKSFWPQCYGGWIYSSLLQSQKSLSTIHIYSLPLSLPNTFNQIIPFRKSVSMNLVMHICMQNHDEFSLSRSVGIENWSSLQYQ